MIRTVGKCRGTALVCVVLARFLAAGPVAASPRLHTDTIVELRVHGNQALSDEDVLGLAGVAVGDRIGEEIVVEVERQLLENGRFDAVDVRRRYLSLVATDQMALILVVQERAGATPTNPLAQLVGPVWRRTMFLPVLDYTEGCGFTYGGRASLVDILGTGGRVSVPATWGGTKQIAVEVDKPFETGILHRIQAGAALEQREDPHFEINDERTTVWVRVTRRLPGNFRVDAHATWADVRFGARDDRLAAYRVTLAVDTTNGVTFPRDAVFAEAGFEWLDRSGQDTLIGRPSYEVRGYKGLIGQTVLAVRGRYQGADGAVPPYELALLGGAGSLRGWAVGKLAGDQLAAASAELRLPFSSPLSIGTAGANLFFDVGTVFEAGQFVRSAQFRQGAGAGLFFYTPLIRFQLEVAHNLVDTVRLHVGAALSF